MNARPSLAYSRFVKVYAALGILLVASIWLFLSAMDRGLVKGIVTNRVVSAERLVRSNFAALDVYDTRRVREEFVKAGIIEQDQDFDILRPAKERAESLARIMKPCSRCQSSTCGTFKPASSINWATLTKAAQSSCAGGASTTIKLWRSVWMRK